MVATNPVQLGADTPCALLVVALHPIGSRMILVDGFRLCFTFTDDDGLFQSEGIIVEIMNEMTDLGL